MGSAIIGRFSDDDGAAASDAMKPRTAKKSVAAKKTPARRRQPQPSASPLVDQKNLRLLRQSFAQIEPQSHVAALTFYRNLFTLDPSLRPMFHTNIELQGRKLMEALGFTVATLENPKVLLPELEAMGRRHLTYGVRDEHYDTVLQAMMLTLAETLGPAFTPKLRAAWNSALGLVAETMKRGAAPVAALKKSVKKSR